MWEALTHVFRAYLHADCQKKCAVLVVREDNQWLEWFGPVAIANGSSLYKRLHVRSTTLAPYVQARLQASGWYDRYPLWEVAILDVQFQRLLLPLPAKLHARLCVHLDQAELQRNLREHPV